MIRNYGLSSLSEAAKVDRLDAEYFQPDDIETLDRLRADGAIPLMRICQVLNGSTPTEYDETGPITVVRSGDLVAPLIYPFCGRPFLRCSPHRKTVWLRRGDVLVSSIGMGSIGKISLVVDPVGLATVSEVTILRDSRFPPEFLFCYLSSSIGQQLIAREVTGATGQQHLLKSMIGRIPIPRPQPTLVAQMQKLIGRALDMEQDARTACSEAEQLMVDFLGLGQLDLGHSRSFETSYSYAMGEGRLDADYFSPRFQNLLRVLEPGCLTLGDSAILERRRFRATKGTDFAYIEIGDVSEGTAEGQPCPADEAPTRAQWVVWSGDIITSTVRPIRRLTAIIPDEMHGSVCSSGFAVLRPLGVEPEVLLVFLRLPLVCELLDLSTTASMYPAVSIESLLRLPVRFPPSDIRQEIATKVQTWFQLRKDSRAALAEARHLLELTLSG